MPMMKSQILNLWISQKQKSSYLENEIGFLQKKKKRIIKKTKKKKLQIKGSLMAKNSFIADVKI